MCVTHAWFTFFKKLLPWTFFYPLPASWKVTGLTFTHVDENNALSPKFPDFPVHSTLSVSVILLWCPGPKERANSSVFFSCFVQTTE